MTKHLMICTLVVVASVIGGCAKNPPPVEVQGPLPAQSFKREWKAELPLPKGDSVERLFVREDLVFVYTRHNEIFALSRGGPGVGGGVMRLAGIHIPESPVKPYPPVVLKDRIVIPTASTMEIYTRKTGSFERSYNTNASLRTAASGWPGGNKLYFGVDSPGGGRIVALDTGGSQYKAVTQKWELMSTHGDSINSAPAVWMGTVYSAFDDGEVYAVNAETRAPIWPTSTGLTFRTFGPVKADVKADDFGVYVASTDSKLYCLDRTQGKVKWQFFAGGVRLTEAPQITASMVYQPVYGRGIVAIDKINGGIVREPKWSVNDCTKLVAEDDKYAYFQRKDNVVVALDKNTGEQKFASKRRDLVVFASNYAKDGMVYAATTDGQVFGISPVLLPGTVGEMAWLPIEPGIDMLAMQ